MKSKREILKELIKKGNCMGIICDECPYYPISRCVRLRKIGAMAILRQNRKKREFDPNKIFTSVTASQAKVGMKGYFSDTLFGLKQEYIKKNIRTLTCINSESICARFEADKQFECWILFYPIEED